MKVYKFGGASIATPAAMKALLPIVAGTGDSLVMVVSALGKTTNALEQVVTLACAGRRAEAAAQAEQIRTAHKDYAAALVAGDQLATLNKKIDDYFLALHKAIDRAVPQQYDFCYDQVVVYGELLSTCLFDALLGVSGLDRKLVDARTVVRTDNNYRDAVVNWEQTKKHAHTLLLPELSGNRIVLTQGFIGSSPTGDSVTLGREGSDYTAALLAAMLGAESVTIWKDVDGFRNADPKLFPDTVKIDALTYNEVIEMAYYGAQIIHPKTIKPLQNFHIPLYVKCFLDANLTGSVICDTVPSDQYPPLIVLKQDQVLLQVTTRDFSFITEDNLSRIYATFHELKIKVNMIQNAAISFVSCIDNREDKVNALIQSLSADYRVLTNHQVSLLTIRHYDDTILERLTRGRQILLKQETRKTIQVVLK